MSKREKLPNRKLIGSKRVGEKIRETGKFSNWKTERSKLVGEKVEKREKSPNRKLIGSKRVGEKIGETEKSPNGKVERSKLIGEKIRKQKDSPNLENGERKDS